MRIIYRISGSFEFWWHNWALLPLKPKVLRKCFRLPDLSALILLVKIVLNFLNNDAGVKILLNVLGPFTAPAWDCQHLYLFMQIRKFWTGSNSSISIYLSWIINYKYQQYYHGEVNVLIYLYIYRLNVQ